MNCKFYCFPQYSISYSMTNDFISNSFTLLDWSFSLSLLLSSYTSLSHSCLPHVLSLPFFFLNLFLDSFSQYLSCSVMEQNSVFEVLKFGVRIRGSFSNTGGHFLYHVHRSYIWCKWKCNILGGSLITEIGICRNTIFQSDFHRWASVRIWSILTGNSIRKYTNQCFLERLRKWPIPVL